MKKLWLLVCLALLLTGCASSRHQEEETEKEETTEETTTVSTWEEQELDAAALAEFDALFAYSMEEPWYNLALVSRYAMPEDVDLYTLFYNGFRDETLTQAELDRLEELGMWMDLDIQKNPAEKMDQVLRDYFGVTLEESAKEGLEDMIYLEETDSYYKCCGDFCCMERVEFTRGYRMESGRIRLWYGDYMGEEWVVTLDPQPDGTYHVISNLPAE